VGVSYGLYNLHVGGDHEGTRLNKIYRESLDEAAILTELDGLFDRFKKDRKPRESFGDFSFRACFPSS
jgi:sulfite reductase (NADPH) hemoprotein beta-component